MTHWHCLDWQQAQTGPASDWRASGPGRDGRSVERGASAEALVGIRSAVPAIRRGRSAMCFFIVSVGYWFDVLLVRATQPRPIWSHRKPRWRASQSDWDEAGVERDKAWERQDEELLTRIFHIEFSPARSPPPTAVSLAGDPQPEKRSAPNQRRALSGAGVACGLDKKPRLGARIVPDVLFLKPTHCLIGREKKKEPVCCFW